MKGKRSHNIIQQALTILVNLDHRGACGCETNTGDGAGILMQVPHGFMTKVAKAEGFALPEAGHYGVGMVYCSPDPKERAISQKIFEEVAAAEGQKVIGWRDVPTALHAPGIPPAQRRLPR
jgi:glutamate synthase (ferredoxin)